MIFRWGWLVPGTDSILALVWPIRVKQVTCLVYERQFQRDIFPSSSRHQIEQTLFNFFRQVLTSFNFFYLDIVFMAPLRILILGHSFILRLHVFLLQNSNEVFARNLHIDGDLSIKWHGIGGRTISKVIRHDLEIVETFAAEIVVIQLGTNDLSSLSAVETGSALGELSRLLHES